MWSPTRHITDGIYATREDLLGATEELRVLTAGPVIVAAFSGRWLFRSLSLAASEDEGWNTTVIDGLQAAIAEGLEHQADKRAYVAGLLSAALDDTGAETPHHFCFGANLERPGGIALIVAAGRTEGSETEHQAELIAACALASRPAAFSLDTSLELAVLSELRKASEQSRPSVPSLSSTARADTIDGLLRFASGMLRTSAIVVYEADRQNPHRFVHLDRKAFVSTSAAEDRGWMPSRVRLTENLDIPTPPELGGSRFDSLGELVDHCFLSKRRPRRLVGIIADCHRAYCIPYGFDDVRRRPIGVLCLLWPLVDNRNLGPYELAAARMVALHLARGYDTRHSAHAVGLVTGQLSFISNDTRDPSDASEATGCDPVLSARRDVKYIAPSVVQIVNGLVNLSGAMSVTCRILTGTDGASFSRSLVRLHSEGDPCAKNSPDRIALGDSGNSVNAWVAANGSPVYLRTLTPHGGPGYYTSPDLPSYEGLERVAIYRDGIQCELCVPIFAEQRLVGTVNLESDRRYAFDAMAETVREYAQLIGVALLESRRRIGVQTVTEVDGILTYRHQLEAELEELAEEVSDAPQPGSAEAASYRKALEDMRDRVFMRRLEKVEEFGEDVRVADVIAAAMRSLKWARLNTHIHELTVEPWSDTTESVYTAPLAADTARALAFAVAQALHNVRKYGGAGKTLAGRRYSAMFRFGETRLGGRRNLYIAVSSTCAGDAFETLDPQQVFRQPIEHADRVSLGAFLAGEAIRRCGGSAYLRVTPSDEHDPILDAEFSVPAAT